MSKLRKVFDVVKKLVEVLPAIIDIVKRWRSK
jgi:hypothetical protein